jgi:hypothetical protein
MSDPLAAAKLKAETAYNAAADYFDAEPFGFWARYGRRTVERLRLQHGEHVLDVGCGTGASIAGGTGRRPRGPRDRGRSRGRTPGSERAALLEPITTPEAPVGQSRDPGTTSPAKRATRSTKTTKSEASKVAKKSRIRGRRSPAHVTAKRAQPVPNLRGGSERAELVGTTSDGHWILSLSDSGKRITVPPRPGFAPP